MPDEAGLRAAERILELARGLTADDLVICLISGGGSSLLPLPGVGVTLEDKQAINRALLASGATITEMNCVRRHLSAIKGGRLAAACYPARVVNLLISDVPGDHPPVHDDVRYAGLRQVDDGDVLECRAVRHRARDVVPAAVRRHRSCARVAQDGDRSER